MIVCLCAGVNDKTIRRIVEEGASSVREVGAQTGAGTHCGSCCCDVRRLLQNEDPQRLLDGADPTRMVLRR